MARSTCAILALSVSSIFLTAAPGLAQQQPPVIPPPEPVPTVPAGSPQPVPAWSPGAPVLQQPVAVPQPGQPQPQQVWQTPTGVPPVPPPAPLGPPPPPPVQIGGVEAIAVRPEYKPGLFAEFDLSVLSPSLGGHLSGSVPIGNSPIHDTVTLPYTDLNWTGSPHLELGYRFGDLGAAVIGYRSVVSKGSATVDGFDPTGPAYLQSRLNLNAIDLMYVSPEYKIDRLWDLRWDAGLRIGAVYFDSQLTGPILSEHATNNFVGAGPFADIEARRYFDELPGFSAFGRIGTGVMIGGDSQSFAESVDVGGGQSIGGASRFHHTEGVPMFNFKLGVSYSPPQDARWFRVSAGYEFEEWWNVGGAGGNRGNVEFQGLFFSAEFHY